MESKTKVPPLYICDPDRACSCPQMYCSYLGRGPCRCTTHGSRAEKVDGRPDGRPVPCDNIATTRPVSRLSQPRAIAWWDDRAHAVEEDAGPFRDTDAAPEDMPEDTPDTPLDGTGAAPDGTDAPPDDTPDVTEGTEDTPEDARPPWNPWHPLDMREDEP